MTKNKKQKADNPNKVLPLLLRCYLTFLVFIFPLRLSSVLIPSEIAIFPNQAFEWLLGTWAPFLSALVSAVGLILALVTYRKNKLTLMQIIVPGLWALLTVSSLTGFILTTEMDYAKIFIPYLAGITCFSLSVFYVVPHDKKLLKWLLIAIAVSAIITSLHGWQQRMGGLKQSQQDLAAFAEQQNITLNDNINIRLLENRVFATFVYPNSFAGYLLLIFPLVMLSAYFFGRQVEPPKVTITLSLWICALLMLGSLLFTESRAGYLAFIGSCGFAVTFTPQLKKYRMQLFIAGGILGLVACFFIFTMRGLGSVTSRLGYYQVAVDMFLNNPLTGAGAGEFFPTYVRMRPEGVEVTRHTHNMVLSFFSQCGLLAGISAVLCLFLPTMLVFSGDYKSRDHKLLALVVSCGILGCAVHSLADFNLVIPATMSLLSIMPAFALFNDNRAAKTRLVKTSHIYICAIPFIMLALWSAARIPGEIAYRTMYDNVYSRTPYLKGLDDQVEKAAELLPDSPYPWLLYAKFYGRYSVDKAIMAMEKAVERTPHRASMHLMLAEFYFKAKRYDDARKSAEIASRWDPRSGRAKKLIEQLDTIKD